MILKINGKIEELSNTFTLAEFLNERRISTDAIAVALNQEVIPRSQLARTQLKDGDEIEIIRAVAGG